MYIPPHFEETDPSFIRTFVRRNGFATLVTWDGVRPIGTHLLLQLHESADGSMELSGHMARANPQWRSFDAHRELLAVFHGPHAYISASWYAVRTVPTWNYVNVHVYALPRIVEDREELHALLKGLVDWQESGTPENDRYRLETLPRESLENMMNAIVGFRLHIVRIEAAAKLSQNRDGKDREKITAMLRARGDASSRQVADEMERRKDAARGT